MRLFVVATLAASFFATNLLAAKAVVPLPAGKPAGVKQAQDAGDDTIWWIVGGAAAVGVIAAVASSGGSTVTSSPATS